MRRVVYIFAITILTSVYASASDITFKFNLPSFGGNGAASNYYLSLLESQKQPKEVTVENTTLEQFAEDLERRLLSSLASEITNQIFGQDATTSGAFTVGGLSATFETVGTDVVVTITDGVSTTQITVPSI